ncbi:F0F1 ATP synthase subunit B [Paenibacillus contaminans]|uniref:ATP synthase subunit b n=1 Tax=Paenibacillus contaminans TaxID=450362 RepID=A0A329MCD6_9BACL|nr:F0F1 ATP synthase subunit B [Paenibacillus contaminans]RAV17348.1 ATP synthase F0 subunit B [Paenibacillus contaminans]
MAWKWESFAFAILAFAILYWLLNRYAFGPLFGMMEKRREMIAQQMKSASDNRDQADKLLAEQKKVIEEARKEAYAIIEQSRTMSSKQADELIQNAKAESNRIKEDALKDIESEKNKAVAALRGQVSAMAVMVASKIIEKQVDEKSQEELIDKYLKEVGGKL